MKLSQTELVNISELVDEALGLLEGDLNKGEGTPSAQDASMQPDENGDMPAKAGQAGSDVMKPLKKQEEDEEDEDDKDKKKKNKKKMDEEYDKKYAKKSEINDQFRELLVKHLTELGFIEEVEDEPVAKSEADDEGSDRFTRLEKSIGQLSERLKVLAESPATGRKSVDGLRAVRKSEDDIGGGTPDLDKNEVLGQLQTLMEKGDNRVNPLLITQYEVTGDPKLVEGIIR